MLSLKLFPLLIATFIWGLGFVATRWTLQDYSPTWSNSLRFLIAGIIAIPFLIKRHHIGLYKGPLICSIFLLIGLQFQTMGIAQTTLAKSGFLTVFYAIFTPMISVLFFKKRYSLLYWAIVFLALFGIGLLCDLSFSNFNRGDLYTLIGALFFSFHILAVDRYVKNFSSITFNLLQCFYIGILGTLFALLLEGLPNLTPLLSLSALAHQSSLLGFILLAIFSSHIAFALQMVAQKNVPPHLVSICFLLESVFAAIFGYFIFSEKMTAMALSGAMVVVLTIVLLPYSERQ